MGHSVLTSQCEEQTLSESLGNTMVDTRSRMWTSLVLLTAGIVICWGQAQWDNGANYGNQEGGGQQLRASPYILYGPHGYHTYPHSRCQEVPTAETTMSEISGTWYLQEYVNSHDGKPIGANTPYLCPEARMEFEPARGGKSMNVSQISYEWPVTFLDIVEWEVHPNKSSVFFHEEGVFSLWTMKVMEVNPTAHMVIFLCIDYTVWPGWNHRGVYVLSREKELQGKIKRKLSDRAHRRMRMVYDRKVNTTSCEPDDYLKLARTRWHPHKKINKALITAPIGPYMSRKYRRNLSVLN